MVGYAVINVGGKQHRISEGEKLLIDLQDDKKVGDVITINEVLMVGGESYHVGTPNVENASVKCSVTAMGDDGCGVKGKKVVAFKKKRRKGFKKTIGHRQRYTEISIDSIDVK